MKEMSHREFKAARIKLRLSVPDFALMLDTSTQLVTRMQSDPNTASHRPVAARMTRLINAYLEGYRPKDWPPEERWINEADEKPDPVQACSFVSVRRITKP